MTALILPDNGFSKNYYLRIKDVINEKFNESIILFALDRNKNLYKEFEVHYITTTNEQVYLTKDYLLELIREFNLNRFVLMRKENNTNSNISWEQINFPFYRDIDGGQSGIRPVNNSYIYEKNREINKTFSKINNKALLDDTRMHFFPYNYFQNVDDISKVDQFGFRINQKIDKTKKLIIILGGSGSHDLNAIDNETITTQLNNLLNPKYQVLNYSLPGYVLLNEMILYILMIKKLKPYMVITYDGVNDFLNGIQNDKKLVTNYNLNYTHYLEKVASKIYGKNTSSNLCATIEDVVISYIERKKQFEELLNNDGVKFISILQPLVYSKSSLSQQEIDTQTNTFLDIYKKIPDAYQLLNNLDIENHLDLHKIFSQFDDTYTLFSDSIYQLPLANKFIAKEISYFLANRNLI